MRVVVTGSAGVIGSRLHAALAQRGCDVLPIDVRRDAGEDICLSATRERIVRFSPDLVVHCAAAVSRLGCEDDHEAAVRANVLGTLSMVRAASTVGARLLNFSTSEVYGHTLDAGRAVAEDEFLDMRTCTNMYAVTKLAAEGVVRQYAENYDLSAVTVRPFMVFGPPERPAGDRRSAMSQFIDRALRGEEILVHRGTERAWLFIDDLVAAVLTILDRWPRAYEIYNIGSSDYLGMDELASRVASAVGGSRWKLVDPPRRFASRIKRASFAKIQALGWTPRTPLADGIAATIAWQRGLLRDAQGARATPAWGPGAG